MEWQDINDHMKLTTETVFPSFPPSFPVVLNASVLALGILFSVVLLFTMYMFINVIKRKFQNNFFFVCLPVTKLDTISGKTSICSILMSSSPGNEKYLTSR